MAVEVVMATTTLQDVGDYIRSQPLMRVADVLTLISIDLRRREICGSYGVPLTLPLIITDVNTAVDRLRAIQR
jgi:hypothetical protein